MSLMCVPSLEQEPVAHTHYLCPEVSSELTLTALTFMFDKSSTRGGLDTRLLLFPACTQIQI